MKIVKPEEIPSRDSIVSVPTDPLMDVYKVCQKMDIVCEQSEGIGLSAVQVGIPWKLFVARCQKKSRYFVDCEYEPVGDKKSPSIEGCLSLRDAAGNLRRFLVDRFDKVRIKGKELLHEKDLALVDVDFEASGLEAIVLQHEIDHHRGILISDFGQELVVYK